MPLNPLTLNVNSGIVGRPFSATVSGLSAGSTLEIGIDGTPGFSTVNGRVSHQSLPYQVNTLVLRETLPGEGVRESRIDIQADGVALGAAGLIAALPSALGQRSTLDRIKRAMAAAAITNPDSAPLFDPAKVTVTIGTADDTTLTQFNSAQQMVQKGLFAATGGQIYYNPANGRAAVFSQNRESEVGNFSSTGFPIATTVPAVQTFPGDATKTGLNALGPIRLYANTEAPKINFRAAATAAGASLRLLIDDGAGFRYVDKAGYDISGSNNYMSIDLAGVRSRRGFIFETQNLSILFATRIDALSRWTDPTPLEPVSALFVGESHTQSGTNGAGYWDGWVRITADKTGIWDAQVAGVASTGFIVRGSTGNFATIGEAALRWITRKQWSMIVIGGGYNDAGQSGAAITAAVLALARAARAANPNALIVILGVEGGATGPSAGIIAVEQAKKAAFDQFADGFSVFIPISAAAEPWEYGTGRVGATNGSGNSDIYFGPDTSPPHKNLAGERYFAERMNVALRQAVVSLNV